MAPSLAFTLSTPFLGTPVSPRPTIHSGNRKSNGIRAARMVLDTPASNTYLQRHAEVVLRDFLTRRSVHTVMYYMMEMHDGPSREFLKRFDSFDEKVKADKFTDGDSYLERMMSTPNQTATVRVGPARFGRTYEFTIQPNRIAKRILQSRIQIAGEWARDLRCIDAENLEIQRLGFEKVLCSNENDLDCKKNLILDTDPFSSDNTPLRWKNYQALKTLTTQHAVARLLPYARDRGSNHEYMYLLQFVNSHGPIGDSEKFLNELMERPLESRTNPVYTIHPRSIALQILELRSAIAHEWIQVMEYIPEEHRMMTMDMLERSMKMSTPEAPGEDIASRNNQMDKGTTTDKEADGQISA